MKNRYLAVATVLVLSAILAQAQTGAVYSLNVVGFQKVGAQPTGLTMPGMPFDAGDPELNQVIGTQLTGDANYTLADNILMWDANAQAYRKYFLRIGGKNPIITNEWVDATNPDVATTNAFIGPTDGFWIYSKHAGTQQVVLVGDVVDDDVVTNAVRSGLNLVSYPYSTERAMNEMSLTSGTAEANYTLADNLVFWDADAQMYRKFYFRTGGKNPIITNKWVDATNPDVPATNVLSAGAGFWYTAKGADFNWVVVRPYTLD